LSVVDRPDHTGTIYISGSVTIPISIEASVVTFNVNIVGSTATLSVDIVASSVTFNAVVTASDIMMPVDIQAQYITLDINIAASAVTLNVNITASAVTLNVAIQSSAVTLNVNISSSSVTLNVTVTNATLNVTGSVTISGTANVQITAQTVGVSVQGEWQVEQGNLNVNSAESTPAAGSTSSVSQTVPAGKVLYVYGCSFAVVSHTAGADNPQECYCYAGLGAAGATRVAYAAVNEGTQYASLLFNTPIKVTAGQTFGAYMKNVGSVSTDVGLSFWGYEKSV